MGKAKQSNKAGTSSPADVDSVTSAFGNRADLAAGVELRVKKDYLDMAKVQEENGLPHAGYLVVVRGEVVRILYMGSTTTGDADWLYAEVTRTLTAEPVGRRGWLPLSAVDQPVAPEPPPRPTPEAPGVAAATRANTTAAGGVHGRPPEPPPPPRAHHQQQRPSATAATRGSGYPASGGGGSGATAISRSGGLGEAFPRLGPPAIQPVGASPSSGGGAFERKRWGPGAGQGPPPEPEPDREPTRVAPKDVAKAIERQRAAAAAAAAKKSSRADERCPICADAYSTAAGRRRLRRPCCNSELCALCDHKSLRSGKCYFCREASDEFPSLGLACRVAAS